MENGNKRFPIRTAAKVIMWTILAWIVLIVAVEIAVSSRMMTKVINRLAAEYVDGSLSFGKVSLSMFKRFPNASITLEDCSVTYPSDRYDSFESSSPQGHLLYRGTGENEDTLAYFQRLTASISPGALLLGKVRIPYVGLSSPRIFAHRYTDEEANWNIFKAPDESVEKDESGSSFISEIQVGRVRFRNSSRIVYTDSRDTIFAMINLRKAGFDGRLTTGKTSRNRIGLNIDSLFVAGRASADTIALGLDRLHINEHGGHMDFHAEAKAFAATRSFGRIRIPVNLGGTLHFPEDTVPAISIKGFKADIASIPLSGDVLMRFNQGRTDLDGHLSVTGCDINGMLSDFVRNFIPEAGKIKTNAILDADLYCKSSYVRGSGKIPECRLEVRIPSSSFTHKDLPEKVVLSIDGSASVDSEGKVGIALANAGIRTTGLEAEAKGSLSDIMSEDPLMDIDAHINADIAGLAPLLTEGKGAKASGTFKAALKGRTRLSLLDMYSFSQADLTGEIESEDLVFVSPDDSISIRISGMGINIGPEDVTSKRDTTKSFRLAGISGQIDTADISYKGDIAVKGNTIALSAKSAAAQEKKDTSDVRHLGGHLSAKYLSLSDASGMSISLDETSNGFQVIPKRSNPKVPLLTLNSVNRRITLVTDVNRAILTDASIRAMAAMNSIERKQIFQERMDSLQKLYPDTPRDSLLSKAMAGRPRREIPEWMKEEDFRKDDINITIDQSISRYFREWDLNGDIDIRTGIVMTPYFPLRNILRGCEISFDNDRVTIDSLKVAAGASSFMAKGELSGLRRTLTGRKSSILDLKLDLGTEKMDANELLAAYSAGMKFNPEEAKEQMAEATNAEFLKMVISDTLEVDEEPDLIVIPGNLNAEVTLDGKEIGYSDFMISDMKARLSMKERCVRITEAMAISNVGNVDFEGFYATRSKKDIRTGFNFGFRDITAEKAIGMFPAIDTLMPLLKSFSGKLNCELAATADLDTNMNVITPTLNGVVRISGDDLAISDNEMFTSLAKKLKFNNKKTGTIKHMTVEGVIKDNVLEIFPFVVNLDRYTLAMSGKQNLDKSYRYHASVIHSPMILKIGVDIYGPDFDNMKFKIGKAKYKNEKVPVFTAVIDQTRINLAESIRNIFEKGVEDAVRENENQSVIDDFRQEIGYVNAVDQNLEELSEEEQKQIEGEDVETQKTDTTAITENKVIQ